MFLFAIYRHDSWPHNIHPHHTQSLLQIPFHSCVYFTMFNHITWKCVQMDGYTVFYVRSLLRENGWILSLLCLKLGVCKWMDKQSSMSEA
jgi:hypothetical protein